MYSHDTVGMVQCVRHRLADEQAVEMSLQRERRGLGFRGSYMPWKEVSTLSCRKQVKEIGE